mmetsp:Transcript_14744/g.32140  ORF Transcript_14744/g.32140 Transcript_14744/m.32140 type:complete len:317 (-) Transcript_14744:172-1122(-)
MSKPFWVPGKCPRRMWIWKKSHRRTRPTPMRMMKLPSVMVQWKFESKRPNHRPSRWKNFPSWNRCQPCWANSIWIRTSDSLRECSKRIRIWCICNPVCREEDRGKPSFGRITFSTAPIVDTKPVCPWTRCGPKKRSFATTKNESNARKRSGPIKRMPFPKLKPARQPWLPVSPRWSRVMEPPRQRRALLSMPKAQPKKRLIIRNIPLPLMRRERRRKALWEHQRKPARRHLLKPLQPWWKTMSMLFRMRMQQKTKRNKIKTVEIPLLPMKWSQRRRVTFRTMTILVTWNMTIPNWMNWRLKLRKLWKIRPVLCTSW